MDDTRHVSEETVQLQRGIDRLKAGDTAVRGELLNIACNQLMRLTAQLKQEFDRLDDNKQLDKPLEELFAGVSSRLYEALHDAPLKDSRHFYQLASLHIRRELVELCRREGPTGNEEISELATFYECIDALADDRREVFELIWYYEMSREEVAELLDAPLSRIKRLWRSARLELHGRLDEGRSGDDDVNFAGN